MLEIKPGAIKDDILVMRIQFFLRFNTAFGQSLWISANGELGTDLIDKSVPMTYLNQEFWIAEIKLKKEEAPDFKYKYILKNADGEIIPEFGNDRNIQTSHDGIKEINVIDTWNHAGDYENAFYTAPFCKVLLDGKVAISKPAEGKKFTHIFKVKAPLLKTNESICLSGYAEELSNWNKENPILLVKEGNWWVARVDLSATDFPVAYKFGTWNIKEKSFIAFEKGNNRMLYAEAAKKKIVILHDGFVYLPNNTWKGAGVAVPVFSLRSKKSFGVGEFADLKLLADWAKSTALKLIQILPVNDTTASYSWSDSYPYAAISAFALHPIYINLEKTAGKKHAAKIKALAEKQKELNAMPDVNYVEVLKIKLETLKEIYNEVAEDFTADEEYLEFYKNNRHWLVPYAAFCFLRDKYGSSDYSQWATNSTYNKKEIEKLSDKNSVSYKDIAFHYFVQFHLHKQLKEAADYAHKKGIVLKGDIAIGVYRYGCDTWVDSNLFNMDYQAGAPPDDFAVKGQNWGFPTYNWKKMQEDHFDWWRKRFEQMSNYFDAFRIDHILGFFRIWSIPNHAVEGIMGHFVPAIPVSITEFSERGIHFDYHRYCQPYITNTVLYEIFGDQAEKVTSDFVSANDFGSYDLKVEFNTQRKVEKHFNALEAGAGNDKIKYGLFALISNVILFEEPGTQGTKFHFRIAIDKTSSYRFLDYDLQQRLNALYINYFFQRQDDYWMKEAMHKLPYLKRATNMLICGEDLGMVPDCVPDVMKQLGILSLEIQRMPKNPTTEFFHPNDAPYLSVITPSTHDMSTIRGWWEEDKTKIQKFFDNVMGQWGDAPVFCEPHINRAIVLQHFYSPAMWSIFQLQDLMGINGTLRRENPHEERINVPADPHNKWKYRMHIFLEDLIQEKDFNDEVKGYVINSGR